MVRDVNAFEIANAADAFRAQSGDQIESLPLMAGFSRLVDFYEHFRAEDAVPLDEDGDAMLLQWGPNRYETPETFEVTLTRQLICDDGDEEPMFHLALNYAYPAAPALAALGSGNQWFMHPSRVAEIRDVLQGSDVMRACAGIAPNNVTLTFEQV